MDIQTEWNKVLEEKKTLEKALEKAEKEKEKAEKEKEKVEKEKEIAENKYKRLIRSPVKVSMPSIESVLIGGAGRRALNSHA